MTRPRDNLAYPIRIRILIPPTGFGGLLDQMEAWLEEHASGHAKHTEFGGIGAHVLTLYLRTAAEVTSFFASFPTLTLADLVPPREPGLAAPHHSSGRHQQR